MLGAAPRTRLYGVAVLIAAAAAVLQPVAANGHTFPTSRPTSKHTSRLWAVQLDGKLQPTVTPTLFATFAKDGINAIVTLRGGWTASRHSRLVRLTKAAKLRLIEPRTQPHTRKTLNAFHAACATKPKAADACAILAPTVSTARSWLRLGTARYVVVHASSPSAFAKLRLASTKKTRVIGVVRLPKSSAVGPAWQNAVTSAAAGGPDLAVTTGGAAAGTGLTTYLGLLGGATSGTSRAAGVPPGATTPSAPRNLTLLSSDQASLTVGWTASTDNVGVAGYEYFVNGNAVGATQATAALISGLACGTSYTVGVEAFDDAGNHSTRATLQAQTQANCFTGTGTGSGGGSGGGGGGGASAPPVQPTPDTAAPTTPPAITTSATSGTSVTLSWGASTDNVGVAGYGLYMNSIRVGTTTGTSSVFPGLTCGTSYTLGVDAYDDAGNRSTVATLIATTNACPDTSPPTTPVNLAQSSATQTSVTAGWTASTDNVGVTGYRVLADASLAGTASTTSYTVTGLACGTSHQIVVDAFDAAGNRSPQATATMTTSTCAAPPPGDTTPPSMPTGLSASSATQTSLTLSWTAATDNVGVTGYGVYSNSSLVATPASNAYTLSGLACGTSYAVGVDAYDAAGNRSGRTAITASTSACPDTTPPTTPTGLALASRTTTSISVTWTASTDNVSVIGYGAYRNTVLAGSPPTPNYTFSGLTCGTSYNLAVDAADAAGNRSTQAATTLSTNACPDTTPPTTPTGLTVSSAGQTTITIAWTASTDNVGVTGYGVYNSGTLVASPTTTSSTLTGLTCGTSYTLAVDAADAAGNRSSKATVTTSTAACPDTTPPSTPTGLATSGVVATAVTFSWNASSDNVGVTGYRLYQNGSQVGTSLSTSYLYTGLTCGTSYTLGVVALDAAGNISGTATLSATTATCGDTTPPSTPTGLSTTAVAQTSVTLSWTASTDNIAVTGYGVYNGGTLVASPTATSYTLSGLTCGTTYPVAVDAVDAAGNRSGRTAITASTSACPDTTPPTTPTGLALASRTTTSISVTWTASTDNVSVIGYGAYRNTVLAGSPPTPNYTFSGLTCGTSYNLAVDAADAAGNRSTQAATTLSTNACPDTTPPTTPTGLTVSSAGQTTITIAWTASTDNVGVTGYGVYNSGTLVASPTTTSSTLTGLTCGTSYTLAVDAADAAGNRSSKATVTTSTAACPDTTPPSTPTGLATSGVVATAVTFSWNASSDNVGVTGYRLYQNGSQVGTSLSTSYLYTGLTCGTSYTLGVVALDAAGNISGTATLSATTATCGDTTPPSTPTGLSTTAVAQTSVTLSWTASTDNIAVTGYRLYQGGSQVGTATATNYAFSGLTCATSYTLGVAAVDAAGNVSAVATISVQSAACSTGGVTPTLYVAQTTAGSGDGSSCTNAKPATLFNTASNWGSGKPIAPGAVVGLCGTITSTLTVQGDGASGSPITIQFQTGAKISQPVCSPCLSLSNHNYITVDGGANGVIESNANGTNLANHSSSTGISANPCNNCEIKNLTIQNIYVIASGDSYLCSSGCAVDNAGTRCLYFSGHDWKIDNNTMHDASWCLYEYANGTDANNQIYNNNIYNIDHGWAITGGGPYGHLYFHNNHVHDMGLWDFCAANGNNCHHDGIHCFFGPGSGVPFADSYIYDNVWDGTMGASATAWIYLESNSSSPCADSSSRWYIFNNKFSSSDQVSTNAYVTIETGTVNNYAYEYNNTFSGPGAGHYGANSAACADLDLVFENNAVGGCSRFVGTGTTQDYNAYANGSGGNCWPTGGCTFTTWQATGKDTHSVYNAGGAVGSNAAGVGTNLTSLCTGDLVPLCSDINGNARPTTGPWNAGAG